MFAQIELYMLEYKECVRGLSKDGFWRSFRILSLREITKTYDPQGQYLDSQNNVISPYDIKEKQFQQPK
jgi:hypothetical protein